MNSRARSSSRSVETPGAIWGVSMSRHSAASLSGGAHAGEVFRSEWSLMPALRTVGDRSAAWAMVMGWLLERQSAPVQGTCGG